MEVNKLWIIIICFLYATHEQDEHYIYVVFVTKVFVFFLFFFLFAGCDEYTSSSLSPCHHLVVTCFRISSSTASQLNMCNEEAAYANNNAKHQNQRTRTDCRWCSSLHCLRPFTWNEIYELLYYVVGMCWSAKKIRMNVYNIRITICRAVEVK